MSLSAQPGPGWMETHRHSRISALGPNAKYTWLFPGKIILMEWEQ